MNNGDQEMMELFVQESSEHIQTLETDLISLESNPAEGSLLNSIFRSVHSIKGAAGFFGFDPIVKLAHVMESVMSLLRDGQIHADPDMVTLLISTSDKLRLMLAEPEAAAAIPCDDEAAGLQAVLDNHAGKKSSPRPAAQPSATAPEPKAAKPAEGGAGDYPHPSLQGFEFTAPALVDGLKHGQNFYAIQINLEEIHTQGQTLLQFFGEMRSIGGLLDTILELPEGTILANAVGAPPSARVFFQTPLEPFILSGALGIDGEQIGEIPAQVLKDWVKANPDGACKPPAPAEPTPPAPLEIVPAAKEVSTVSQSVVESKPEVTKIDPKPVAGGQRRKAEETIRINVGLLDTLMNLAGEMVLGRNKLLRLSAGGRSSGDQDELHSVVQEISSVTSSLQDTIMRARLQPVGGLFGKFTRIVRDLSHKLNKEIQLEIFGDDVELDRTLLEGLSDPLTHLIRNSIDHGIEKAGDRLAAGKAAHGTVRLSAAHLAGRVQIEVTDDGAGMDPERLKAKAVEKGVISPDQAQRLSDSEALNLIFAAGFSTAAAVSDISGRGVGMDVVKTNIEKLGGHVDLDSQLGKGTRITIRLPLTLAIVPALIVGCRGSSYALPQINVEEIVRPSPECPIKTIGGARVLELRGELIPVVDLAGVLNEPSTGRDEFVVLLQLDHSIFGLIVDEIRSNEEIVVKPLGRHLRTVPYYSGATLLGQGEIALILDPTAMAQGRIQATQKALGSSKALETTEHAKSSRVLVFQAGGAEPLAVPLGKVLRVESVDAEDIERIGAVDCLRKKHDSTIRLVQFSDLLPLSAPEARGERFFIIVPRPPYDTVGFIATKILDSIDLPDSQIEQGALSTQGLLGSAVILGRLTLVIDMPSILEMLAGVGLEPASLVAEGRFLLTTNPSQNQNHPIKQLPAQPGQNNPS
jgi:two-component system chemotaxis sensor kinase CheA